MFSVSDRVQDDFAAVGGVAVFEEEDALPGAEEEGVVADGDGEAGWGDGGAEVGGHVVGAFVGVAVAGWIVGGEGGEVVLDVGADVGAGVFLDEEGGRGVAAPEGEEACRDGLGGEPAADLGRDVDEAGAVGVHREDVLRLFHRVGTTVTLL